MTEDEIDGLGREYIDGIYCPQCYPDCAYTRFTFSSSFVHLGSLPREYKNFKNKIHIKDSTIVKVYFNDPVTDLYFTSLVYSWEEMLSVFGSLLSVFFGFSIISLLEVFYFGLWRTFQYYHGLVKEDKPMKVYMTDYKSIEQEFLRISMRKNLYPLPTKFEFLREIQPRKPIKRIINVEMY